MRAEPRTVAITGANGFIGRNLTVRLSELGHRVLPLTRATAADAARQMLAEADTVFHLAGASRPEDLQANREHAASVAKAIAAGKQKPLVVVASSLRAGDGSDHGQSRRAVEEAMLALDTCVAIYRLPDVFGKWARPDHDSAVAVFCHNIARGLPVRLDHPETLLALLYIDDLIDQWCALLNVPPPASGFVAPDHVHHTSAGDVVGMIQAFAAGREGGGVEAVGTGLARALYATYIGALPVDRFSYPLVRHADERGSFTEVLKTRTSGQVSVMTAYPGETRGGHYHHSKVEKFLVVHGRARFRFRHILTGATHEVETSAEQPVVVETIPGWTHDITNIGKEPLVSLIWANEIFDRARPDTVARPL